MQVRTYEVLQRAIEQGIRCGIRRAYKHTDKPTEEAVIEHLEVEIMNAITGVFWFTENE